MSHETLIRVEDSLWALYASGARPGDENNVHLDNLASAYEDFLRTEAGKEGSESVLASIEAACEKLEASLRRVGVPFAPAPDSSSHQLIFN